MEDFIKGIVLWALTGDLNLLLYVVWLEHDKLASANQGAVLAMCSVLAATVEM